MAEQNSSGVTRREFIEKTAATGAAIAIVPRHVLGRGYTAPSDLLNIASVGIGGMGHNNLRAVSSQNIVAVCDVDWDYAGRSLENYAKELERRTHPEPRTDPEQPPSREEIESRKDPARQDVSTETLQRLVQEQIPKIKRYTDYREMLDKQKDIDAIIVATPDHMHAVIASAAMQLGKHVYVQKPLTWSVEEARRLAQLAKEKKVATQMGNQGHSHSESRMTVEYIKEGAIGDVREVHVWTNRPLGYWPQGLPRPKPLTPNANGRPLSWNGPGVERRLAAAMFADGRPTPDTLNWDLFIGGSKLVDYHPVYHPFNWRGWVEWGQGALGDMGAHLIDFPFWALDLGMPTSVETISTPFNDICYPNATTTYYEFAARGSKPAVKLTWYDGGLLPPRPEELGDEMVTNKQGRLVYKEEVDKDGGVMFIGSKGKLMHETYGWNPRLLPKSLAVSYGTPKPMLPRIQTSHEMNWVQAAKGEAQASSPFEYAARLVEVMLLGVVSLRARSKIYYDGEKMQITNLPWANELLKREYREGYKLS